MFAVDVRRRGFGAHDLPNHAVAFGEDVELAVVVDCESQVDAATTSLRSHTRDRFSLAAARAKCLFGETTQAGLHLVDRCDSRRVAIVGREHVGRLAYQMRPVVMSPKTSLSLSAGISLPR